MRATLSQSGCALDLIATWQTRTYGGGGGRALRSAALQHPPRQRSSPCLFSSFLDPHAPQQQSSHGSPRWPGTLLQSMLQAARARSTWHEGHSLSSRGESSASSHWESTEDDDRVLLLPSLSSLSSPSLASASSRARFLPLSSACATSASEGIAKLFFDPSLTQLSFPPESVLRRKSPAPQDQSRHRARPALRSALPPSAASGPYSPRALSRLKGGGDRRSLLSNEPSNGLIVEAPKYNLHPPHIVSVAPSWCICRRRRQVYSGTSRLARSTSSEL